MLANGRWLGKKKNRAPRLAIERLSIPNTTTDPGYFFAPRIASLAALATRNFTTRLAAILMASPVAGFRPIRAFRFTSTSLPKPGMVNLFFAFLYARATRAFRASVACFLVTPTVSARDAVI